MNTISNRKPSQNFFVIIFEGRTGSSYVVSCLNKHPQVLCYPEIFANPEIENKKDTLCAITQGLEIEKRVKSPANLKRQILQYAPEEILEKKRLHAVGFKLQLPQFPNLKFLSLHLQKHCYKLIHLKRNNIIKSVVSELNAHKLYQKHKTWNATNQQQIQKSVYIPPKKFYQTLKNRVIKEREHQQFYNAYTGDKKTYYYEYLQENHDAFLYDLFDYLNLMPQKIKGDFFKNTSPQLQDAIQNYDEIKALLKGTYFEQYFTDNAPKV